jgi:hypothetical protein
MIMPFQALTTLDFLDFQKRENPNVITAEDMRDPCSYRDPKKANTMSLKEAQTIYYKSASTTISNLAKPKLLELAKLMLKSTGSHLTEDLKNAEIYEEIQLAVRTDSLVPHFLMLIRQTAHPR